MIELLFGMHVAGWKAMFQFWFWTGIAFYILYRWIKWGERNGN
jgi:hypothetical protein